MQRLEVSGAVRHIYIYISLGCKGLMNMHLGHFDLLNELSNTFLGELQVSHNDYIMKLL
jgi:hypothetical protein